MADVMTAAVAVIILVAVGVGIVGSLVNDETNYTQVTNESFSSVVNNSLLVLAHEPVISGSDVVTNSSGKVFSSGNNYTIDLRDATIRWVFNDTTFNNSAATSRLNVSYQYQPSSYVTSSIARSILPLILVFLGILAVVVLAREGDLL